MYDNNGNNDLGDGIARRGMGLWDPRIPNQVRPAPRWDSWPYNKGLGSSRVDHVGDLTGPLAPPKPGMVKWENGKIIGMYNEHCQLVSVTPEQVIQILDAWQTPAGTSPMGQVPFLFPGGNPANVARMFGRDFSQNKSESVWPWVVGGVLVLGLGATTVLLVRAKKKKRRKALAAKTKATKRRKALAAKTKATK